MECGRSFYDQSHHPPASARSSVYKNSPPGSLTTYLHLRRIDPMTSSSSTSLLLLLLLLPLLLPAKASRRSLAPGTTPFADNYAVTWGGSRASVDRGGRQVQLSMDNSSGSGFASKLSYGSGSFRMRIKLPAGNTAGVVTAFYLSSGERAHDELDFEFLGNVEGKLPTLQTNVFANGRGNREQRIRPWFDPSADFHDYKVLWNPYQIVFFVDDTPIRVYRNETRMGADYPSQPMRVIVSLWNGESWATDGGRRKVDWSGAPFRAEFRGFDVDGCPAAPASSCSSSVFWWNAAGEYSGLNDGQRAAYERVKMSNLNYDYCTDKSRHPRPPPECH